MLLSLACAASCADLIYILATNRPTSFLASYVLEVVALFVAPFLTYLNHYRTRTSSAILLLFWPVYALAVLIWGRTALTISPHGLLPVVALRSVVVVLGFVAFALECLGPEIDEPEYCDKGHAESPLLTANIFSQWSFSWMNKLMKKGATEYITENDLPGLRPKDEAAELGNRLKNGMEKQYVSCTLDQCASLMLRYSSSLWMALFVAYGGPYAFALGLKLIQDSLAFLQPQLLRWLLSYIASYQSSRYSGSEDHSAVEGFSIAAIMFGASIVQTIILHQVRARAVWRVASSDAPIIVLPTLLRDWNESTFWIDHRNLPEGPRPVERWSQQCNWRHCEPHVS